MIKKRVRILDDFRSVAPDRMGDCFLLAFSMKHIEEDVKSHKEYVAKERKNLLQKRISLDQQQQKWCKEMSDIYNFDNFTEALNVCMLLVKDNPAFSTANA